MRVPSGDQALYEGVIATYGEGVDPVSVGTVSFRSFMNLYRLLHELGTEDLTAAEVTAALESKADEPSYMGHDYTCDRQQFDGLPAMCSPQQILAEMVDQELQQVGDWVEVGEVYQG